MSKSAPAAIYGVLLIAADVPDAHRRDGHAAQTVGALAAGCRAPARQRQPWRFRSRSTRPEKGVYDMKLEASSVWPSRGIAAAAISVSALAQKKYDTGADRQGDQDRRHQARIRARPRPTAPSARRSRRTSTRSTPKAASTAARSSYISLDDGYNPAKTVEQARKLVEEEEVLFVFNPLGTPSNTAIHKYMNSKKVPQLFVATGATKWGDPKNFPWTMGWQPNYQARGQDLRRSTSSIPSPTPRSACSTRTTTTARTT